MKNFTKRIERQIVELEDKVGQVLAELGEDEYNFKLEDQLMEYESDISTLKDDIKYMKRRFVNELREEGYTVPNNPTDDVLQDLYIDYYCG